MRSRRVHLLVRGCSSRPSPSHASVRERLLAGVTIPAHPLALTADGAFDETAQRALTRYYLAAGADGLAVGVHTTQFTLHDDEDLFAEVLTLAERTAVAEGVRPLLVAGVVGDTEQVERGPDADAFHQMNSLVVARGADRRQEFDRLVAHPDVAVVTLTITEAGYLVGPDGVAEPANPLLRADITALRDGGPPRTAPGRLLAALGARRHAGGAPIAVVSCDNVLANGARIRSALLGLADEVNRDLGAWLRSDPTY